MSCPHPEGVLYDSGLCSGCRIADLEKRLEENDEQVNAMEDSITDLHKREADKNATIRELTKQLSEANATIAELKESLELMPSLARFEGALAEQEEARIRADERSKIELTFGFSSHMHRAPSSYQETKMTLEEYRNQAFNEAVAKCVERVKHEAGAYDDHVGTMLDELAGALAAFQREPTK